MSNTILRLKNLSKEFPGVKALNEVSFSLEEGEVLALLGENGAGKSTLIKCLTGANIPTSGTIELFGKTFSSLPPALSRSLGISAVYQEFNLVPDLPIVENVFMGNNPGNGIVIDYKQMLERCSDMFSGFGLNINPKADVSTLSPAMMQIVEITKAIMLDCKILILDEPTAPLTLKETEILFRIIRDLKAKGVAIIYISHRLEEVFEICSRAVVLRDGEKVGEMDLSKTSRKELIRIMIGRELTNYYPQRKCKPSDQIVMNVSGLVGNGNKEVSFEVHKGEILGFAGLVGAGRTEVALSVFGADGLDEGTVYLNGEEISFRSPSDAVAHGVCYLSEDRKISGLFVDMEVRENVVSACLRSVCSRAGFLNQGMISQITDDYIKELDVHPSDCSRFRIRNLSGGNQQKILFAKWLAAKPSVLIVDEPTRGVDVGAKSMIHSILRRLAESGMAVMMISSELPEILGVSDRVMVMSEGRKTAEFEAEGLTEETVMNAVFSMDGGLK